jgi:hypothetical protein
MSKKKKKEEPKEEKKVPSFVRTTIEVEILSGNKMPTISADDVAKFISKNVGKGRHSVIVRKYQKVLGKKRMRRRLLENGINPYLFELSQEGAKTDGFLPEVEVKASVQPERTEDAAGEPTETPPQG